MSSNYYKTTKYSSGIACCRKNTKGRLEILLVRKRLTHNYVAFVFGQYTKNDDERIKHLFNGMTVQEKIDILSLRFDILWYRIWMEFPGNMIPGVKFDLSSAEAISNTWKELYRRKASNHHVPCNNISTTKLDYYIKKKNKFDSSFVSDNGERLRSLISDTNNIETIWEIPKGRKKRKEKTYMDCAIREFEEETGVNIDMYNIMFNVKHVVESYITEGVKYVHYYYIAFTSHTFNPCISLKNRAQISEVDAVKWVDIDDVDAMDHSGRLRLIVDKIFTVFRNKYSIKP